MNAFDCFAQRRYQGVKDETGTLVCCVFLEERHTTAEADEEEKPSAKHRGLLRNQTVPGQQTDFNIGEKSAFTTYHFLVVVFA
jgi:hypothetical protein